MIIIRPIKSEDAEQFIHIAFNAGIGMTSMPKNKESLIERIANSEASFAKFLKPDFGENYLFVLEDLENKKIGGTSGIITETGRHTPLFFFKIEHSEKHALSPQRVKEVPLMRAIQYKNYWTEICALFLLEEYRKQHRGKLLSLSRFLFMAEIPHKFSPMIFAELRGKMVNRKTSLFWEGVGKHLAGTDFETLMHMRDTGEVDLEKFLPKHPIYIEMLPKEIQSSICQVHEHSKPALNMLLKEGFTLSQECDICDGGPKIEATLKNIRTLKNSLVGTIVDITAREQESDEFLISNRRMDFRACLAPIKRDTNQGIRISKKTAEALNVTIGDSLRYTPPSSK